MMMLFFQMSDPTPVMLLMRNFPGSSLATYKEAKAEINRSDKIRLSNKTHYSPTDPDARLSCKPGKATKLNYNANIAVDTAHHIITDVQAYHADKKDS